MRLADLIAPDSVFPAFWVPDKTRLISELSAHLAARAGLRDEEVRSALQAREALGSTGIGGGIAVPHAWIPSLARPHGVLAKLTRPIDFEAVDENPVDLVCAMIGPETPEAEHLTILAAVSRALKNPALRERPDYKTLLEIN